MSGLPIKNISKRSDRDVQLYFDTYFTSNINFNDNEYTAVEGFFTSRGFDKTAAKAVSITLLNQAKTDGIKVFSLLDTLEGIDNAQLTYVVAEVLNYNRKRTSVVGFKKEKTTSKFESRNIIEGTPAPIVINIGSSKNFSSTGFTFDSDTITWDGE